MQPQKGILSMGIHPTESVLQIKVQINSQTLVFRSETGLRGWGNRSRTWPVTKREQHQNHSCQARGRLYSVGRFPIAPRREGLFPMPLLVSSPMQRLDPPLKCVRCGHPILWKESRVTDDGRLVHEACLAAKLEDKEANPQADC